ncbi:hypothetical protein IGI04_025375 [Brassica rapa subsp. trilocularis]|uniref:Uncharacterized protein n=1 Tax=Brassica rapa subsp. trilocularis TaxID=1813537 RepID=A0ABQ7M9Z5_BRACM|nr:hypothetical protein IGI04_025375 [Brassica rapa subsp. trilocularis]
MYFFALLIEYRGPPTPRRIILVLVSSKKPILQLLKGVEYLNFSRRTPEDVPSSDVTKENKGEEKPSLAERIPLFDSSSSSDEESGENGEVKEKKRKKAEGEGPTLNQFKPIKPPVDRVTELTHRVDSAELASRRRITGTSPGGNGGGWRRLTEKSAAATAARRRRGGSSSRRGRTAADHGGSGERRSETAASGRNARWLRRTATARAFHARAEAKLREALAASSGLRLRCGWCLRLLLDERNTMVVLHARDDQWVLIGGDELNVITAHGCSGDELRTSHHKPGKHEVAVVVAVDPEHHEQTAELDPAAVEPEEGEPAERDPDDHADSAEPEPVELAEPESVDPAAPEPEDPVERQPSDEQPPEQLLGQPLERPAWLSPGQSAEVPPELPV